MSILLGGITFLVDTAWTVLERYFENSTGGGGGGTHASMHI
jgi:hypothetical protein